MLQTETEVWGPSSWGRHRTAHTTPDTHTSKASHRESEDRPRDDRIEQRIPRQTHTHTHQKQVTGRVRTVLAMIVYNSTYHARHSHTSKAIHRESEDRPLEDGILKPWEWKRMRLFMCRTSHLKCTAQWQWTSSCQGREYSDIKPILQNYIHIYFGQLPTIFIANWGAQQAWHEASMYFCNDV